MIQCAEDFIGEKGQGIQITKAIITVPAHFTDKQRDAVKAAAKLAGIEIPRIINEPTAAALAYGLGCDLIPEEGNKGYKKVNTLYSSIFVNNQDSREAPLAIEKIKSKSNEKILVFDLGGGTLDITLLNIKKNSEGIIDFDVEATDGDTHLGGADFDNILIDFVLKIFVSIHAKMKQRLERIKKSIKD